MDEYNLIDKFFDFREEENLENIQIDLNTLKNRVRDIKRKKINRLVATIPEESSDLKEQLINSIDNLVADYNVLLAYYNKKYYKQGFEDANYLSRKCNR